MLDTGNCKENQISNRFKHYTVMFNNSSSGFPLQNSSLDPDSWCQNSGDSTAETAVKVLAYVAILLVSLVGNALVIMVTYKDKRLRKSINFFVLNMAVSDLFTPLTIMPIRIVEVISGSYAFRVYSPLILGDILCKLCYFLPDVSFVVSVETLLLLSMDRFIAVVFPLKSMVISSKARLICILCTWVFAIAVHAPYLYAFKLSHGGNDLYCWKQWTAATENVYVTATFITFIIIPICILAIVYGTIAWTLKKRHKQRKVMSSNCPSRINKKMNKQIIRLSVAIMMSSIVCMAPLLVLRFIQIFLWHWRTPPQFRTFKKVTAFCAIFMVHSWSAINPCICFIFNKHYRMGLNHALSGIRMQAETTGDRNRVSISSTKDIQMISFRTIQ